MKQEETAGTIERKWLPAEWMDEVIPPCGESPDAFVRRDGDTLKLCPLDWGTETAEEWPAATDLSNGQIVQFCWTEQYGYVSVTPRADGSFEVSGDIPESANLFAIDEAIHDNIGDLFKDLFGSGVLEASDYDQAHDVFVYAWSNPIPFRLTVLESGAGKFEQAAQIGEAGARELVEIERNRQVIEEGWSAAHDDAHDGGQLLAAARCYLDVSDDPFSGPWPLPAAWPWEAEWWKPKSPRLDLVRAGALCLAERDRLCRLRDGAADCKPVDELFAIVIGRLGRLVA